MREFNFDGLVGPTHNYGGLSAGNVASMTHGGQASNPRKAALQGLAKARFVASLGVGQAVLPPHPRPSLRTLHALGFRGADEDVLAAAARDGGQLLRLVSSAAAMWTANAATVAPSCDTADGRLHLTPANLQSMFHRSIEAPVTTTILRTIFSDSSRFEVHDPLPGGGQFADEGAANHTRLSTDRGVVHLFGWGRVAFDGYSGPKKFPARQTREAFEAIVRLHQLDPRRTVFAQQHPDGIDAGAFHTDVLAVGTGRCLLVHELAFADWPAVESALRDLLGETLSIAYATNDELPIADAVATYPFNSQLLALADGTMTIIAPADTERRPAAKAFLDRVVASGGPVKSVHFLDVRESMDNGGGPACLRLRVPMTEAEARSLGARVLLDDALATELEAWVTRHYRDRLVAADLADPKLCRETMAALDELTGILRLGSVYEFQTA